MNDQELRQIVRQAIAKIGVVPGPVQSPIDARVKEHPQSAVPFVPDSVPFGNHASHAMYMQLVSTSTECVIEPSVQCDHCGYCKSHGH